MLRSAICKGVVRHRRFSPKVHNFSYNLFMALVDLDDMNGIIGKSFFWSYNRFNLMQFKRSDYLGGQKKKSERRDIKKSVCDEIFTQTGRSFDGRIQMLTHPRGWGVCFNPVTFYFCRNRKDDQLRFIVAEINNTPWHERYAYVLTTENAVNKSGLLQFGFNKEFHVSPFMQMDIDYRWVFGFVGDGLSVHMECLRKEEKIFDATMKMIKYPFSTRNANKVAFQYPFMCAKVLFGIYWQAFRLYLKKVPFYDNPKSKPLKKQEGRYVNGH